MWHCVIFGYSKIFLSPDNALCVKDFFSSTTDFSCCNYKGNDSKMRQFSGEMESVWEEAVESHRI